MTGISLKLYQMSGAIQLDMSRPGYEKVRSQVEKEADDKPFDSAGKIDDKAVKDFDGRIDKYQEELKKLGNFDPTIIDDSNLGINDDSVEQTPTDGQSADNATTTTAPLTPIQ